MMRFDEEETLKDKSRCANVRADLKMCLLQSDCCKIVSERETAITYNTADQCRYNSTVFFLYICIFRYKRTPKECLRSQDGTVPDECFALQRTFFECKHSIIDGRRRFRGPRGY
ncbi:Uncharacterized protein C2orf64 like protein [Trachymyrmex cornetzi]|uniref:Cytochrome c oxidase assembly factor 5 n=1 Tax=Trachymyrmex cornetzi TaxID=471704 RepID=A0A151IUQ3_9HYME|nr:Uncharacterized protein C2orf64 like protein [Trachymyrmex cornetzi]